MLKIKNKKQKVEEVKISKEEYDRLKDVDEEYGAMFKQWREMGKRVGLANKSLIIMAGTLKTVDGLLKDNFNVWLSKTIKAGKAVITAKVSTFRNEKDVADTIEGAYLQAVLVKVAQNSKNYYSGGSDLCEMFMGNLDDSVPKEIREVMKEGVLKGAVKLDKEGEE